MRHLFGDGRAGIISGIAVGIALAFCGGIGLAQNPSSPDAEPATKERIENGKRLYNAVGCWACHGYSGQGGTGTRLAPDPLPLAVFTKYCRTPTRQMPPYTAKVLKDSDLSDIHAFLKTIPKAPDQAGIPLLKSVID